MYELYYGLLYTLCIKKRSNMRILPSVFITFSIRFLCRLMTAIPCKTVANIYALRICADVAKQFIVKWLGKRGAHSTHTHTQTVLLKHTKLTTMTTTTRYEMSKWNTLSNNYYRASGSHKWI